MLKKLAITGIIVATAALFGCLAHHGWTHRYGPPAPHDQKARLTLSIPYRDTELVLDPAEVDADVWQAIEPLAVPLLQQVTQPPWPVGLTPSVNVQAFHNGREIYFKLAWEDDGSDVAMTVDKFVDACAIAFPSQPGIVPQSIMMGYSSPVYIWHWKADADAEFWNGDRPEQPDYADRRYPFEDEESAPIQRPKLQSAVMDMISARPGSLTIGPQQLAQGRGQWKDGRWAVVFKRTMVAGNDQCRVQPLTGARAAAFAIWNGGHGDRGARKSLSQWVILAPQRAPRPGGRATQSDGGGRQSSRRPERPIFRLFPSAEAADPSAPAAKEPKVINVTAQRFKYTPNVIKVHKGELITLRMESLDVTHGLYLDGYELQMKADPSSVGKITFVADKTGRFTFRCSETCGEFHPYMIGFLHVTPNSRFTMFAIAILLAGGAFAAAAVFTNRKQKGASTNA